ncbi:MAG: 50S ribosomal protein L3 [Elusimicrobia bacterium]|nr:50S ribosomal protein L3 [Elusimicrobiota bacterium]
MTEENKTNIEETKIENQNAPSVETLPAGFKFIIGEKVGMTQMFDSEGFLHSVSVVKAGPCRVLYTRTKEKNGYNAVCLGFRKINKTKNLNNSLKGLFAKLNVSPLKWLKEFRVPGIEEAREGQIAGIAERFSEGDYVDIRGISKGKGFAGGMKRHNFSGQPGGHGASDKERAPGSLAGRRSLGRVLPGKRMAGHMGQETVTVQKVKILKLAPQDNLMFLDGSVPGANGSMVCVLATSKPAKKHPTALPKAAKKSPAKKTVAAAKK